MDLSTTIYTILEPQTTTILGIGIEVTIQPNHIRILKIRSSLAKSEIFIEGGVIDQDYRGPLKVIIHNNEKTH